MKTIDDGGPAFARPIGETLGTISESQVGLSLDDWFAGMALQGMCSQIDERRYNKDKDGDLETWRKHMKLIDAAEAYAYAGAMREARKRMLGSTEPGQAVNASNVTELPPGSVVRNGNGSRLIHLHDDLWLWCSDHSWCYERIDILRHRLDAKSTLCHIPA